MRVCRHIAAVRRQVKWLVAFAEKRAAEAIDFRPLIEAETESVLGGELLATLGGARRGA
jgi:hypothetical protein